MLDRIKGVDELQELARIATRAVLATYERIPAEWEKHLTLGILFDGDDVIFELCLAAERPSDAVVISSARVNRNTKSAIVVISNLDKKIKQESRFMNRSLMNSPQMSESCP